jgi:hypothetical protein
MPAPPLGSEPAMLTAMGVMLLTDAATSCQAPWAAS